MNPLSRLLACCLASMLVADRALAAPQITTLSLRGLRSGDTTLLTIDGTELHEGARLLLPIAEFLQTVRPGATANRIQFDVRLPAVQPGIYPLRVATSKGVSNVLLIGIDGLEQLPFAEQVRALPVALHGTLAGSQVSRTSFTGRKGQRIVVDLEARRLGAAFDPIIELVTPNRVPLAYAQGKSALAGDARLEAVLPADGTYSVELRDALYQAQPGPFRLKIGDLHIAELTHPLGGRRGSQTSVELLGNMLDARSRVVVDVDLQQVVGDLAVPLPPLAGMSGPAPRLFVDDLPVVVETTQAEGKLQEAPVPVAIEGRLARPKETDRYRLVVQPGARLRFDLMADRAGSPLDGVLTLRNDAGAVLAENDDRPDTVDPGLDFTVPAGVTSIQASIRDLQGRGGKNFVYRLTVVPIDRPDFILAVSEDRQNIPQAGNRVFRVRARRSNLAGPIRLTIPNLPPAIVMMGGEIPAGATDALVTLSASDRATESVQLTHLFGEAGDPKKPLRRVALMPELPLSRHQPWLRESLALAVTGPEPIQIAWADGDDTLAIGSTFQAKLTVQRRPGTTGPIRFTLLASQVVPRTADNKQEDMNRALRIVGTATIPAEQQAATVAVAVPPDLPNIPYDLAFRGELLAADSQSVRASAYTKARRWMVRDPISLQLASASAVQAKSGQGPTGKLLGKVNRARGFDKPVTVTVAGLPAGYPAPSAVLPGNRSDFELPIAFPYGTPLGILQGARLVATTELAPQRPLTSNAVALSIQVVRGDPPPAAPPLQRLFEDEADFLAVLTEGAGQAALEPFDRHSGMAALRVTGGQRSRAQMPGWGFKIAEKPGEGEFRYLRFAWKKPSGTNILLELNAGGKWGPARGKPGPSYRYEAGPVDNMVQAAAIKLDSKLPEDWVVVTRDLFADFGAFALTGIALSPGPGDSGLFDHLYLARSLDDFKGCPSPILAGKPLVVFEDNAEFVANLNEGPGTASLETSDRYSGTSSVKVTPEQRFNQRLPGLNVKIRQKPGAGEYRYLRFAWKKQGGESLCLQLNHDGQWGPVANNPGKFRYHAGSGPEPYGGSIQVDPKLPGEWAVVTRDLYADFGEFTLTGLALSPVDGAFALFDHLYLARNSRDFGNAQKPAAKK